MAIAVVPIIYLGWVALLPPTDRLKADPSKAFNSLKELVESSGAQLSGWIVAGMVMLIALWHGGRQHARIRRQGAYNAKLRKLIDPNTLSASDRKELERYASASIDAE